MAPRTGPRVKVISPNSGTVTTLSRSASASSIYSSNSARVVSPASSVRHYRDRSDGRDKAAEPLSRRLAAASLTPPPQPSRAVLQSRDINTAVSAFASGKSLRAETLHTPPPPVPSSYFAAPPNRSTYSSRSYHNNTTGSNRSCASSAALTDRRRTFVDSGRGGGNSDMPDYFAEDELRRAVHAPPSTSRSTSRVRHHHYDYNHTSEPRASSRQRNGEDDEAIRRARAALEHAGDAVLRRPFSNVNGSHSSSAASRADKPLLNSSSLTSANKSVVSTLLGGNTSSLPRRVASTSPGARSQSSTAGPAEDRRQHRGLRLPPTIPVTRDDSDGEDDEDDVRSETHAGGAHKRERSWADAMATAAGLLRRRTACGVDAADHSGSAKTADTEVPVCPGMFKGASAISLDPRLFEGMEGGSSSQARAGRSASAVPSTTAKRVKGRDNAQQPQQQQQYRVQPLWSLVGTFKTSLSGLVAVDLPHDCLRWSQRNPKGGQQCIRVPLSRILDVFTTRVMQEDENIEERQFTVVVRTSTRPSQVVFGFACAAEANHLRSVLQRL